MLCVPNKDYLYSVIKVKVYSMVNGKPGRDRMIVGSRDVPNTLSDKVCQ